MFKKPVTRTHRNASELMEIDPQSELAEFRANFDRMLGHLFRGDWGDAISRGWRCDVDDAENEVVVRAEAPGFEPDEFDIRLSAGRLVMRAEHSGATETGPDGGGRWNSYANFYRAISVPAGIQEDAIKAIYRNGVLEVHLPKGEEAKSKRIAVQAR